MLVDALCQYIIDGKADIYTDYELTPKRETCTFTKMIFWAESQFVMGADISMSILVAATDEGEPYEEEVMRIVRAQFVMKPKQPVRGKVTSISRFRQTVPKHLWNLSSCLVPRMTKAMVEENVRRLFEKYLPEALEDQHKNDALKLAEKMGLQIQCFRLHGHKKARTILFFNKGTVTIEE